MLCSFFWSALPCAILLESFSLEASLLSVVLLGTGQGLNSNPSGPYGFPLGRAGCEKISFGERYGHFGFLFCANLVLAIFEDRSDLAVYPSWGW